MLALGANRVLRSPTFHYHVDASKAPLDLGTGLVVMTIDGDALEPDRSTLALTGTLLGKPATLVVLQASGKSYQRDALGKTWQPMTSPIPLDIFGAERDIASGMAVARSPQRLTDEPIDGVTCHHVIADVPATTLTSTFGTALDGPPVRAEYWIATSDLTVRQVTLTGKITWDATTSTQVVKIVLQRIGAPVVFPNLPQ